MREYALCFAKVKRWRKRYEERLQLESQYYQMNSDMQNHQNRYHHQQQQLSSVN